MTPCSIVDSYPVYEKLVICSIVDSFPVYRKLHQVIVRKNVVNERAPLLLLLPPCSVW